MAEPLKNAYGPDIPRRLGGMIRAVHPSFPEKAFLQDVLRGYEGLALTARARHMAQALRRHLPGEYPAAIRILLASLGPKIEADDVLGAGMGAFIYLPHVFFVADYGLDHFDLSMKAQYELTQRFTAEFSIRAYLSRHPAQTLACLKEWVGDPSSHVRRLVSEGTRPRLPWAPRLPAFQKDPSPVLSLLELLKDDPAEYVRRSVANNLNDIGKDNPDQLLAVCRRWWAGGSPERRRLVARGLRSLVKAGHRDALALQGFGDASGVVLDRAVVTPRKASVGEAVALSFHVKNTSNARRRVMVDFRIHYVKAGGAARPKVFKLTTLDLPPGATAIVGKKVSLKEMTTRRHFPGFHRVDLQLNGKVFPAGGFDLSM